MRGQFFFVNFGFLRSKFAQILIFSCQKFRFSVKLFHFLGKKIIALVMGNEIATKHVSQVIGRSWP